MGTRIIKVRGSRSVAAAAAAGVRALRKGKLVGFATETVYGIAALATIEEAVARLRELKSRPERPFSVHLGKPEHAGRYVAAMPETASRLIERAWPGPVTLVVPTGGELADARLRSHAGLHGRLCHDGLIGLRCPDEPVARAMLGRLVLPVVAPSANLAGEPSPRTPRQVLAALDGKIDLLIDSGPTRLGSDSTIVRCDARGWDVLREGACDAAAIERLMTRTFLFVCTGNTCRSAMADGLAKKVLAEREGCEAHELPGRGFSVLSAGVSAFDGGRATRDAVDAAAELGADIRDHRSRQLTRQLIRQADVVFCMTDSHVAEAAYLAPDAGEKLRKLDPRGDVPDPIGGGPHVYRRTARQIEKALGAALSKGPL